MIKPIPDESEPTLETHAGADDATAARLLRPPQAAPPSVTPVRICALMMVLGASGRRGGFQR